MAGISRDYLGALLTVASRVCGYLEGITPEQRILLERLAEVPAKTLGWVRIDEFRRATAQTDPKAVGLYDLFERGLVEQAVRQQVPHARISRAGLDLLDRIDTKMNHDSFLQRFKVLQKSPAAACKERTEYLSYSAMAKRVVDALRSGPVKREELIERFGITRHQMDHVLRRLKHAGTIWSDNGVYHLVRQEGAA